jgi:putative flippase GtrA
MLKKESKRFSIYVVIGIALTILNYIMIGVIYSVLDNLAFLHEATYSVSFFLGSMMVTSLSFIGNRKLTFRDKHRRHKNKWSTLGFFYLLYGSTALIVAFLSFVMQKFLPNLNILKIVGISMATLLNYSGQKFFIYRK